MDFTGVKNFILLKLEKELQANLYYHNLEHTLDVLKASETYGKMEKISASDMALLKTAALFHDTGFLVRYSHNESDSIDLIHDVLPDFGYNEVQIKRIAKMIRCTEIPQKPVNKLEKILCDADLDYLGRDDFFMVSISLQREWNEYGIITSLKEWYIQELYFLQQHEYFTKSAILVRQEKKMLHLKQIKELLGNYS